MISMQLTYSTLAAGGYNPESIWDASWQVKHER